MPEIRRDFLDVLARQRSALASGSTEAWARLLREHLLNTGSPDLLARKHLRASGRYADALEAVARELRERPTKDEALQARRQALEKVLREEAAREREGKGDA